MPLRRPTRARCEKLGNPAAYESGHCGGAGQPYLQLYLDFWPLWGPRAWGVVGAAIATVLSRFVELAIVVSWAHRHAVRFPYITGLYCSLHIPGRLFRDILRRGTPLLVNEGLWAAGMAMLNQCYSCGAWMW